MISGRWAKRLIAIFVAGILLIGSLVLVLYLMVDYRPRRYQPRILPVAQQEEVETAGLKKSAEFFNLYYLNEPFQITFEQELFNDLLMLDETRTYMDKMAGNSKWPRQIQVYFKDNTIEFMAQVEYQDLNSVLSVALKPRITPDGSLEVTLAAVKAGAIPLPERLVREKLQGFAQALQRLQQRNRTEQEKNRNHNDENELFDYMGDKLLRVFRELSENQQVTLDAVIGGDDDITERVRITGLTILKGQLILQVQPMITDN